MQSFLSPSLIVAVNALQHLIRCIPDLDPYLATYHGTWNRESKANIKTYFLSAKVFSVMPDVVSLNICSFHMQIQSVNCFFFFGYHWNDCPKPSS